jgi:hypothetical protein
MNLGRKKVGDSNIKTTHSNIYTYAWAKSNKNTNVGNKEAYKAVYSIPDKQSGGGNKFPSAFFR